MWHNPTVAYFTATAGDYKSDMISLDKGLAGKIQTANELCILSRKKVLYWNNLAGHRVSDR